MEQIKLELPIDFNTIQEGELRYFFRPFIWEQKKYGLFWEDNNSPSSNKTKSIITDIQISAHQLVENQPKDLSTSVSPIINMTINDTEAKNTTIEHLVNTENNEVIENTIVENNVENDAEIKNTTIEHLVNTENNEVIENTTVENNVENDAEAENTTIEHLVNTENNEVIENTTVENNVENDAEAENTTIEHLVNTENNQVIENTTVENNVENDAEIKNTTIEHLVNTENNGISQNIMSILESYQNIAKRYK